MALVQFTNKLGIIVKPFAYLPSVFTLSASTINAVGESVGFIGKIFLSTGTGTSKTISSAGGKIWFYVGSTLTWANAATNLRVGIQDVSSGTGAEDGTYDVFDDLIPGTDTLTAGTVKEVSMSSGTKTIAHGDIIAVVIEMTARGGTDSVNVNRNSTDSGFPYTNADTGAGPAKSAVTGPIVAIEFDDGTFGHFSEFTIPITSTDQSFGSTSTPDEYAMIFQLPFKCKIDAIIFYGGGLASGDTATVALISDPLGTPVDTATVSPDPVIYGNTGAANLGYSIYEITETQLTASTDYAVSYRATASGTRSLRLINLVNENLRKGALLGTNMRGGTRSDATGAFSVSTTTIPDIGFRISQIDDGSSPASVETSVAYIG